MLELHVANKDVSGGSVAVSWCVDSQLLKELADKQINDPQLVIVVAPIDNYDIRREYRKIVSLKDLMTYVEFRASGPNRIWALISAKPKSKSDAKNYYLTRNDGVYKTWVLNEAGNDWSYIFETRPDGSKRPDFGAEPLTVDVPAGVFAKEPPQWERPWVNYFFRAKPVDQCDYRRRRLLAYGVQPIVVGLDMLARLMLLLISSLWLSRGMKCLGYVHQPLSATIVDAVNVFKGGSFVIPRLPEDDDYPFHLSASYLLRKLWKTPLMPIILLPLAVLYYFHVLWLALLILAGAVGTAILIAVMATHSGALMKVITSITDWVVDLFWSPPKTPWYLDQEEIDLITCSPAMDKRRKVSDLPAKHKTIRLRMAEIKSKVCRPFSA